MLLIQTLGETDYFAPEINEFRSVLFLFSSDINNAHLRKCFYIPDFSFSPPHLPPTFSNLKDNALRVIDNLSPISHSKAVLSPPSYHVKQRILDVRKQAKHMDFIVRLR